MADVIVSDRNGGGFFLGALFTAILLFLFAGRWRSLLQSMTGATGVGQPGPGNGNGPGAGAIAGDSCAPCCGSPDIQTGPVYETPPKPPVYSGLPPVAGGSAWTLRPSGGGSPTNVSMFGA